MAGSFLYTRDRKMNIIKAAESVIKGHMDKYAFEINCCILVIYCMKHKIFVQVTWFQGGIKLHKAIKLAPKKLFRSITSQLKL